jgi:hypothetical protein
MKRLLCYFLFSLVTFAFGILITDLLLIKEEQPLQVTVEALDSSPTQALQMDLLPEIETENLQNNDSEYFSGWYALENYKYKGMPEVNMISLTRDNLNNDGSQNKKFTSYAGVFTEFEKYGDQGFIDSAWAEIEGSKVKFKTNKIKGIEYQFNGTFLNNKTSGEEGEKILRGTLQNLLKVKRLPKLQEISPIMSRNAGINL